MRKLIALLLLVPALALAKSPFDGTWKLNLDSVKYSGKPDEQLLIDGHYTCKTCVPPYTVKADGTQQPTPGNSFIDHIAVKVLSPSAVEMIRMRDGKIVGEGTVTVAADGKTATFAFTDYSGEKPVKGSVKSRRVGPAPKGAHAISGAWMIEGASDYSDLGRTMVFESTDNGMKWIWNGQVQDAKFDGKEYPVQNDPYQTMVTLKKVSDREFVETDRNLGKVQAIVTYTVAADGKTLKVAYDDPMRGTKTEMTYDRQP
jgi:hypothetical protein